MSQRCLFLETLNKNMFKKINLVNSWKKCFESSVTECDAIVLLCWDPSLVFVHFGTHKAITNSAVMVSPGMYQYKGYSLQN